MKELSMFEAMSLTSPNPLTLICTRKADGTTNLAPICFVSCLSFDPPMIGFACGKNSHTGQRTWETGEAVVTVPGESLTQAVMVCGGTSGSKADKVKEAGISMTGLEGSAIRIPVDSKLVLMVKLEQAVEVGDHILHICRVERILGDEGKTALFAWNGFGKAAPSAERA